MSKTFLALSLAFLIGVVSAAEPSTSSASTQATKEEPIVLNTMGSLFFGGTVKKRDDGTTFHGDHGYTQFYIPANSRTYPIILWHGLGQSGRSFESTPDGREGFQALLPRDNWSIYIIDQPRRGRAGRTDSKAPDLSHPTLSSEAGVWSAFRLGRWLAPNAPTAYEVLQMPLDGETLNQFMRQQVPDTGELIRTPEYHKVLADTTGKLLERTGPAILVTHSYSGQLGWYTGMRYPEDIKAIVAYEPGQYVYPEGVPFKPVESPLESIQTGQKLQLVPMDDFKKLTKIPILIVFGDNIATEPGTVYNEEVWRNSLMNARQFVEEVNKLGGDAKLVVLPELGIKGNTHAAFADLNNKEIQKIMTDWLDSKNLAGFDQPHQGPKKVETPLTVPLAVN